MYVQRETAQNKSNKVPKLFLSEIKGVHFENNQEIGLEAATFLRPRNRALALVKILTDLCIEDLTDLNNIPIPCIYIYIDLIPIKIALVLHKKHYLLKKTIYR